MNESMDMSFEERKAFYHQFNQIVSDGYGGFVERQKAARGAYVKAIHMDQAEQYLNNNDNS